MPAAAAVYAAVWPWLQCRDIAHHRTAPASLAGVVRAGLLGQSLRPSVLARTLPSPRLVPARERYRQVARVWDQPWLTADHLTAALVAGTLALVRPAAPLLVLDRLRCGAWEVVTIGLAFHGRVLLLSWSVLPYPWPNGRFPPTVGVLMRQVAAAWPSTVPPPHLVADRAFPSTPLCRTLAAVGGGYTLRLRASEVVTTTAGEVLGSDLLATAIPEAWASQPGRFGRQMAPQATTLVVGQGLVVRPQQQRDGGRARARARARGRAQRLRAVKQTGRARPTAPWLILLRTHRTWRAAVQAEAPRSHLEGSYRDAQTGWDGRHGWDVGERIRAAAQAQQVATVVGLWALATLLQSWLGDQLTATTTPAPNRAVAAEWTVPGRVSVWARGRLARTDVSGRLDAWISATLHAAADRCAAARPTRSAAAGSRAA